MTCSEYISKLIELGEVFGIEFILHDFTLPKRVGGRICYRKMQIRINEPIAVNALMVIAHELGHYWHHVRNKDRNFNRDKREIMAYLYGWGILKRIKAPVTKGQWIKIHS